LRGLLEIYVPELADPLADSMKVRVSQLKELKEYLVRRDVLAPGDLKSLRFVPVMDHDVGRPWDSTPEAVAAAVDSYLKREQRGASFEEAKDETSGGDTP
jgi:hypothetical protein